MKVKCKYCKNEATHYRTPDLDIKGIPICENQDCYISMMIDLNGPLIFNK